MVLKRLPLMQVVVSLAATGWTAEPVQPPYSWRGVDGQGVFPAGDLVTDFLDVPEDFPTNLFKKLPPEVKPGARSNVVWRTALPNLGSSAPVVVGDPSAPKDSAAAGKVFLLCDEGWKSDTVELVCIDAVNGAILWQRPVDHLDAWPKDKADEGLKWRAKNHEFQRNYMKWWHRLYWDDAKHDFKEGATSGAHQQKKDPPADQADLAKQALADGFTMDLQWGKGVSGGWRSRFYWKKGTPEMEEVYSTCNRNRYFVYPGWTTEGPFYGSSMGSVVSDGKAVYAVTAHDAAACYGFDGTRRWVTDLQGVHISGAMAAPPGFSQFHMSSPVLADGKLVYHYRDFGKESGPEMIGLDTASGKILWRTPWPRADYFADERNKGWGMQPWGYDRCHMTPGGTPVVMRLPVSPKAAGAGPTTVVVANGGMVVRVSDGKALGFVQLPRPDDAKPEITSNDRDCSSTYNSWVARDDVIFAQRMDAWLMAVRLSVSDDALKQELVWRQDVSGDNRNINLVIANGRLYGGPWYKKENYVYSALDIATGLPVAKIGRNGPGGYSTSPGFAGGQIVLRTSDWGMNCEINSLWTSYRTLAASDLKPIGSGFLASPLPKGEILDRHIARMGTDLMTWGIAGITCWGNRIFIRNNDYLWCVGDPQKPWIAPERYMAAGRE